MAIEQLSIMVENKQGTLAEIADLLAASGIDLRALSIADTQDFGILRLIVSDTQKALDIIRSSGCIASVTPVLAVEMSDQAGGLARILHLLNGAGIDIEYLYAFITVSGRNACVVLRVADNEAAAAILTQNGCRVMTAEDITAL